MVANELTDRLQEIPGVASAVVEITDDAAPVARIFLDGSRDSNEVRTRVNALLGASLPSVTPGDIEAVPKRRSGLGRGLGEILADDAKDHEPPHINGTLPAGPVVRLSHVGVVESSEGVSVEIADDKGNRRTVAVGETGSIDDAVVEAVRVLLGLAPATTITLTDTATPEGNLVVATSTDVDGRRLSGASFIDFGRPWAAARAVVQAFTSS